MSELKIRSYSKLLIIAILYAVTCGFTASKPDTIDAKYQQITSDTIPEIIVSSKKVDRYNIYLNFCNELVLDTILQSGYLNFDTLRVASIPENQLYFGKIVIKSLQLSKELANIIVMDTIWNKIEAPEYRSTYDYYVLAKYPMPPPKEPDLDYINRIFVFRPKVYSLKRSKPLPYNDWEKYINNKSNRTSTTDQYF